MKRLGGFIRAFSADRNGATAIEYGMIVALISVIIVGSLTAMGGGINGTFQRAQTALAGVIEGIGDNEDGGEDQAAGAPVDD